MNVDIRKLTAPFVRRAFVPGVGLTEEVQVRSDAVEGCATSQQVPPQAFLFEPQPQNAAEQDHRQAIYNKRGRDGVLEEVQAFEVYEVK